MVLAAVGILLLLAAAMSRTVTYDEDQYLAAGLRVADGLLPYRDFVYLQPPLYPFVLGAVFKLSGGYYLLAGRLLTFGLSMVSAVLLWGLLRRLGAGLTLASVLMAACLASPFLASPLANTRNDVLPLTLMLAGLSLYLWAQDRRWWVRFAAAVLMGLAVEAKLTYLFAPVVLGVHALFHVRRRLLPVVLGTLVAAVPGLVLYRLAPDAMRFGLFEFHVTATPDWYGRAGLGPLLTAPARLLALLDWLVLGGNLTLVVLAVVLSLITMARKRKWKRPGALLVLLLVGAAGMAFVPSPSWAMYYAATAPLLACCIAHLDRITTHLADPFRKRILFVVSALSVVPVLLLQGPEVVRFVRGDWVGLEAHRTAVAVRAALPKGGAVATLFPHMVMDANPVAVAFTSGPFVFRSGDLYSPARLAALHALSPDTVGAAFDRDPPAGIFAGAYATAFRTPMDRALTAYAERHDWELVLTDASGARLWVNPKAAR